MSKVFHLDHRAPGHSGREETDRLGRKDPLFQFNLINKWLTAVTQTYRWNHRLQWFRNGQFPGLGYLCLTQRKWQICTWPLVEGDLGSFVCIQCGYESSRLFHQSQQVFSPEYRQSKWVKVVLKWGWFCSPGDLWQCLETFSVVTPGRRGATGT